MRVISEDDFDRSGVILLTDLLAYGALAQMDVASPVANLPIRVPDEQEESKPFSKCTERDLRRAIAHLNGTDVVTPMPDGDVKRLAAIKKELLGLTHDPIRVVGHMFDGALFFDFGGVSAEELRVFATSLLNVAAPSKKRVKHSNVRKSKR